MHSNSFIHHSAKKKKKKKARQLIFLQKTANQVTTSHREIGVLTAAV